MTTIDRYILKQFFQVYIICFLSLTGLYVVFEAFTNLDQFLKYGETNGGVLGVMSEYYGYRTLYFFDRTSGILVLVATMFSIAWLQRHNELTALLAAGIPARRVFKPIVISAVIVSLLASTNRDLVIPRIRNELARDPKDLMGSVAQDFKPRYDNETDILFRGNKSIAGQQQITDPSLLLPRTLDQYGKQLSAATATYQAPSPERPGGYLLAGVQQPKGLHEKPSLALDERPVIITPKDDPQLAADQCFVVSSVSFDLITGGQAYKQYSSTFELVRGLNNPSLDFGADVRVQVHQRIINNLLDLTLFFLGLPLMLTRDRSKPFKSIGVCMVVIIIYMLVILGMQHLGSTMWINTALAAWIPLIIFVPIATWLCAPLFE